MSLASAGATFGLRLTSYRVARYKDEDTQIKDKDMQIKDKGKQMKASR